jgi:hypothetical protein
MRLKLVFLTLAVATAVAFSASSAEARMLGITAPPAGSHRATCGSGTVIGQVADAAATRYIVPGSGTITKWSVNTSGATPGQSVTFVVLRNQTLGSYGVVGSQTVTLPNPLPSGNVANFTLATPIPVREGDTFGLYTNSNTGLACYWFAGSTPAGDFLTALSEGSTPTPGQSLPPAIGNSPGGYTLNLAATLSITLDAGVSAGSSPNARARNQALLSSTVTNHGPGQDTVTFRDTVPTGLTVVAASAGNGTCTTSGQQVTCTISDLASGASVPVNVVVTPTRAGSYVNRVSVSVPGEDNDPVSANNTAATTLNVGRAGPNACVVPRLRGTPARVAKRVLKLLGCKVKVKRKKGHGVAHGAVLKTKPRPGTYKLGRKVTLIVRR